MSAPSPRLGLVLGLCLSLGLHVAALEGLGRFGRAEVGEAQLLRAAPPAALEVTALDPASFAELIARPRGALGAAPLERAPALVPRSSVAVRDLP
ncbi:MAG: hypothetical protein P1V81_15635, partial [Planctomycetota bacterium]|nr:hypothetical protein [Planctomycetota bacterium]